MKTTINQTVQDLFNSKLKGLEHYFNADVLTYYGPFEGGENFILSIIEDIALCENKKDTIYIILTTSGGSVTVVERIVNILRHYYKEVNFIVPDHAYSAGTIFCMSGDNILMDFFSVLGPIDPQVLNREGKLVPALGYLDKVNELIKKAQNNTLTKAEFLILKDFDLAELSSFEQAKNLTIDLLEKWLVKYKFKNWDTHRTSPSKINKKVTEEEKKVRAKEIAEVLSDNNKWKFHGRPINIEALKELRLEIEDYSKNEKKRNLIRSYYKLVFEYVNSRSLYPFIHTRKFIN